MNVIEFKDVSEKYRIKFIDKGKVWWEEILAVDNASFKVNKGEVLGLIGKNGAGKTTILKLIAGMLVPDRGEVKVEGKVSALMELGAGFNPEFTGRENILLNARLYGVDNDYLDSKIEEIIEFAGLGKFINAPVKYYSQGMYMRLAFSLAIYVNPDILLIDDILAVGDRDAQLKCVKKIFELKESGRTIIMVTHDMEMVRRLCDRVILLQGGRIVQEGFPEEIISRYMVLCEEDKKNKVSTEKNEYVISSGKLKLFIDLERKSLKLYYRDKEITKDNGLHSCFLSERGWFNLKDTDWRVEKEKDTIRIKFYGGAANFVHVWNIIIRENGLLWQVSHEGRNTLKAFKFGLFLQPEYKKFFCGDKEIDFPAEFIGWQDLLLYKAKYFGVRKTEDFPAVTIGCLKSDCILALIQNSDCIANLRVLQAVISERLLVRKRFNISLKVDVLDDDLSIGRYIELERKNKSTFKSQGKNIEKSRLIHSDKFSLYVDAEEKLLKIFYCDKEISAGGRLHASFYIDKRWLHIFDTLWTIKRISSVELCLILESKIFHVSQIWTLVFEKANILSIKVEIDSSKEISLTNQEIKLEIVDQYKKWLTALEEGQFSATQYIDGIGPVILKDNRVPGVILKSEARNYQDMVFNSNIQDKENILSLYRRRQGYDEYSGINFSLIIPPEKQVLSAGKHTLFEGNIGIGKDIELNRPFSVAVSELNEINLKFVFDRGKGRIFMRERELTCGLGVFTSVRSKGIWRDSCQAAWQIISQGKNRIVALGYWSHIPISQKWEIELSNGNSILWKVDTEIYDEINLELMQANIMAINTYDKWAVTGVSNGEFPEEFTKDYDILPYRCWYGKTSQKGITLSGDSVPDITFIKSSGYEYLKAMVENTDYNYQARLLQYQKVNNLVIHPGKIGFFEGIIKIRTYE